MKTWTAGVMLVAIGAVQGVHAAPSQKYIDNNGRDCVTQVEGPQTDLPKYGRVYFQNRCGRIFSVTMTMGSTGKKRSGGVEPGKTMSLSCEVARNECQGFTYEWR